MTQQLLVLKDASNQSIGYYIADDEDLTRNAADAMRLNEDNAETNLREANLNWDLRDGEQFVLVPADGAQDLEVVQASTPVAASDEDEDEDEDEDDGDVVPPKAAASVDSDDEDEDEEDDDEDSDE